MQCNGFVNLLKEAERNLLKITEIELFETEITISVTVYRKGV